MPHDRHASAMSWSFVQAPKAQDRPLLNPSSGIMADAFTPDALLPSSDSLHSLGTVEMGYGKGA